MDWLQVAPSPLQSCPNQVAVMTGQFVTMKGPKRVMGLVQQVFVQPGGLNVQLLLHGTKNWSGSHNSMNWLVVTPT